VNLDGKKEEIEFFKFLSTLMKVDAGKPYQRGRISTVDLLVLTSLDQLLFALKLYFSVSSNKLP